jgi:hypothetical protein
MMQEMRISEVEIIAMLIPSLARVENIIDATPEDLLCPDLIRHPGFDGHGPFEVGPGDGERQVGLASGPGVLDDHVDDNSRLGDGNEDFRRSAGLIRHLFQRDSGLILVMGHRRNDHGFHAGFFADHHRAFLLGK